MTEKTEMSGRQLVTASLTPEQHDPSHNAGQTREVNSGKNDVCDNIR